MEKKARSPRERKKNFFANDKKKFVINNKFGFVLPNLELKSKKKVIHDSKKKFVLITNEICSIPKCKKGCFQVKNFCINNNFIL